MVNGGQEFSGDGDSIQVPHDETLNLTGPMTISFWIKPTEDTTTWNRVVEKGWAGWETSYYFGSGDGTNDLTFYLNDTEVFDTDDDELTVGSWHHAAVSYSSDGDAFMLLNGEESATGSYTGDIPGNDGVMYISLSDETWDFPGFIDEVRISSIARSSSWITTTYNNIHSPGNFLTFDNSHLVINEILINPEGDDTDGGEWIEIYNPTNDTYNLDGFYVSNSNLSHNITLPDWDMPPDSYLVVHVGSGANDPDFADNDGNGYKEAHFYAGLSEDFFDNDMDEVAIFRNVRRTLDFDELPAGTIFNEANQPYDNGHGVTIYSNDTANHPAIVFDSDNPTGWDYDLGTPNEDFGGPGKGNGGEKGEPGQNDEYLHEILIIAENIVDENGDGLVDDPDDNGPGGFINVTFDSDVDIYNITFVDSDETESNSSIKTYDSKGTLVTTNSIPALGDNALYFVDINAKGVRKLEIFYDSSGAIGFFHFFRPEADMMDFFAYCSESASYFKGEAHLEAVDDGIWTDGDYFDSSYVSEGESMGRDMNSNDTDVSDDWDESGGKDVLITTQGYQNIPEFARGLVPSVVIIALSISIVRRRGSKKERKLFNMGRGSQNKTTGIGQCIKKATRKETKEERDRGKG